MVVRTKAGRADDGCVRLLYQFLEKFGAKQSGQLQNKPATVRGQPICVSDLLHGQGALYR